MLPKALDTLISRHPANLVYWEAKATVLERTNRLGEAVDTLNNGIQRNRLSSVPWNVKGKMLAKRNRLKEAHQALSNAIKLCADDPQYARTLTQARFYRHDVLKSLHRWEEAAADNLAALGIPSRNASLKPELIDLGLFYNGELLEFLGIPHGASAASGLEESVRSQTGLRFDLRGVVLLWGVQGITPFTQTMLKEAQQLFEACTNVPVNRLVRRLHVLHGTQFDTSNNNKIGAYILHYVDGRIHEYPIIYGRDVRNWWWFTDRQTVTGAKYVQSRPKGYQGFSGPVRLYQVTLENPFPETEVTRIDFVSTKTRCGPFLIAITAEP